MSHDQNFKNLILDYPLQALRFFASEEAGEWLAGAKVVPVRQEQLQERLGKRFRELDVPLLVEWPDGQREALLFVLEEESDTSRFSIHRLAHYCLDLSELSQRRLKYLDFIDIYANLDDNERERYQREYPDEAEIMCSFSA